MCESEEEAKVWVMAPHLISESIIVCRVHSDFSFLFDRTFFYLSFLYRCLSRFVRFSTIKR